MNRGAFVVIDGIDGSGKSTQLALLKDRLGKRAVFTYDPGGTPTGELARGALLNGGVHSAFAGMLLFLAARAALIEEVVRPALAKGRLVICDRFDSSTFAYQVHAGKHPEFRPFVDRLMQTVPDARPDAYIILDMDPARARERLMMAGKKLDTYEKKPLAYHRAVREGFRRFKPRGSKLYRINADRSEEQVADDIWTIVSEYAK